MNLMTYWTVELSAQSAIPHEKIIIPTMPIVAAYASFQCTNAQQLFFSKYLLLTEMSSMTQQIASQINHSAKKVLSALHSWEVISSATIE